MAHYDSCYEADEKDKAEKKHKKIKKELIDLINKLDDDERELLIRFAQNIKVFAEMLDFLKK